MGPAVTVDDATERAARVPPHETAVLCTTVEGSRAAAVGELVVRSRKVDLFWTRLWDGGGYIVSDDALGLVVQSSIFENVK